MVLNGTGLTLPTSGFGARSDGGDKVGTCPRCKEAVRFSGQREHPLAENIDGHPHALTCAGRVRSAVLIVKPAKVKP